MSWKLFTICMYTFLRSINNINNVTHFYGIQSQPPRNYKYCKSSNVNISSSNITSTIYMKFLLIQISKCIHGISILMQYNQCFQGFHKKAWKGFVGAKEHIINLFELRNMCSPKLTKRQDTTFFTQWFPCIAKCPSMINQLVAEPSPFVFWNYFHQIVLNFLRILIIS